MSTTGDPDGAWHGDPERRQASISAARAALAAGSNVVCAPRLFLPEDMRDWGNVYCTAYGTADPAELETRSGLSVDILMLTSAALSGCDYYVLAGDDGTLRRARLVERAVHASIDALEAIPVGANPLALARSYVVDFLRGLAASHETDGRLLAAEQRRRLQQLAELHESGEADPAEFRTLRRMAAVATDAAQSDLERAALAFAESVSWPLAGLTAELPDLVRRAHKDLRACRAPERPSPEEVAQLHAVDALFEALEARRRVEPTIDVDAEVARIVAMPVYLATQAPAFRARLQHCDRVAAEAYAPFAIDLVIGAFRRLQATTCGRA